MNLSCRSYATLINNDMLERRNERNRKNKRNITPSVRLNETDIGTILLFKYQGSFVEPVSCVVRSLLFHSVYEKRLQRSTPRSKTSENVQVLKNNLPMILVGHTDGCDAKLYITLRDFRVQYVSPSSSPTQLKNLLPHSYVGPFSNRFILLWSKKRTFSCVGPRCWGEFHQSHHTTIQLVCQLCVLSKCVSIGALDC